MLGPHSRRIAALLAFVVAACHTNRLAPVRLWAARSSAAVLAISADSLAGLGFKVDQRDTTKGTLYAVREAGYGGNADYLRCSGGFGNGKNVDPELFYTVVAVTVIARDTAGGASVAIAVAADAYVPRWSSFLGSAGTSHWRCTSSGLVETVLAGTLRARTLHRPI